jgi:hypothetical protein
MNNLGVFFTCYTELEAVEYSIDLLETVYPDIPVYIVSDGGSDYSFISEKYKNIRTSIESDSRGILTNLTGKKEDLEKVIDSIFIFMRRIKESIDFCGTEYLLIMEPDILVRGELNIPEGSVLLGSKINPYLYKENEINTILKKYGGDDVSGYGCTPVILRCDSFLEIYDFVMENPKFISEISEMSLQVSSYDVLLPVLFALKGHKEQFNPDIIECLRDPDWSEKQNPLVHQFRKYYPKKNYSGRHAGDQS